jgi:ribosomal protein S6
MQGVCGIILAIMSTVKTYELSFLALPHLSEEEVGEVQTKCRDAVRALDGEVASFGDVHFIPLAYEMTKKEGSKLKRYNEAYFAWMKFTLASDKVGEIENLVETNADILRAMVVLTNADAGNSLTLQTEEDSSINEDEVVSAEAIADTGAAEMNTEAEDDMAFERLPQTNVSADDLTRIEGIGPVIATTLENDGIMTFAQLRDTSHEHIEALLEGVRGGHDPSSWGKQAALACEEKWEELDALQERLRGGAEAA